VFVEGGCFFRDDIHKSVKIATEMAKRGGSIRAAVA
jgi:hypothetical protein